MERKKVVCFIFVWVFLSIGIWLTGQELGTSPVAISPGSETEMVTVWQSCPTFSWSSVDWAVSYRVAVFPVEDGTVADYETILAQTSPVILKEINGPALSWTLSAAESLKTGAIYVWYVQALDRSGSMLGSWSNGRIFKVDQEVRLAGIEEKLGEILKSYGVSEDVISNAFKDIKSEVKEVAVRGVAANSTPVRSGVQGLEGDTNTFYGLGAGSQNTTGYSNTFIGRAAGISNSTAGENTFIGAGAGYRNSSGFRNVFVGYYSGYTNTSGKYNTFLGMHAGHFNSTGDENTLIGEYAGYYNTTGYSNAFLGNEAGYANTEGFCNTFMGRGAGYTNTTGNKNAFLGYNSGYRNTTGYGNAFIGEGAGFNNTTGYNNTIVGNGAGTSNTSGNKNVFLGMRAGYLNTIGTENIFLGNYAGYNETTSNKLYIANSDTSSPLIYGEFDNGIVTVHGKLGIGTKTPGYPVEVQTTGINSSIVVKRTDGATNYINATNAYANFGSTTNHPLRLVVNGSWKMWLNPDGSLNMSNGASLTTGGVWTNASSRALKENIQNLSAAEAVDALTQLNPVKYNYKVDRTDKHVGFIAEDVPDLVATVDRKGLSPMDVTAVLTKVAQEQQKLIADLNERISKLEQLSKK